MNVKPLAIVGLAAAIVAAAGVGSYLAVRSSQTETQAQTAATQATGTPAAPDAAAAGSTPASTTAEATQPPAVDETEASLPPAAEPVEKPKPSPAKAKAEKAERAARSARASAPASRPEPPLSQAPAITPSAPTQVAANTPAPSVPPPPPPEPPAPPKPRYEELTIPADSVIGLSIDNAISTDTARPEDRVDARVTRDVRVGGEVAIPAGTRARGNVTVVEEGGKFKDRARLGVRFHTLVLADGTSVPIQTETVYRVGDAMGNKTAAKIGGGAAGGAIIGAILGGGKGAAIGSAIGAGAGAGATAAGSRSKATMPAGSTVTVRLSNPATVTVQKDND